VWSWLKHASKLTRSILVFGATAVGALILVEGVSSVILFSRSLSAKGEPTLPERRHARYDATLGWVSIPNLAVRDMYGRGVFLRTNARGFRGHRETGVSVPNGKVRVICSGDSFTLGYGVDDDHAWCQMLASLDHRLEPVNMGQGGYGTDQAFLWYQRDGRILNHDLHIFAFITDDFVRMEASQYLGYGKPVLDLVAGRLVVKNVPVPRRKWYTRVAVRAGAAVRRLKAYELAAGAFGRVRSDPRSGNEVIRDRTVDVALKVFAALQQTNDAKKSALVLVHLPAKWDYPSSASERLRQRLAAESIKRGWTYVDLIPEMRSLPPKQFEASFFADHGHYTAAGNAWVAQKLYQRISALPYFSRKMETVRILEQGASVGGAAGPKARSFATAQPRRAE
jgi:hypothetical protein